MKRIAVLAWLPFLILLTSGGAPGFGQEVLPGNWTDRLAPERCLFYSSWSNAGAPDLGPDNATQQLLAEPEVKAFVDDLVARAGKLAPLAFAGAPGNRERLARRALPRIVESVCRNSGCFFVEKLQPPTDGPPVIEGAFLVEMGDDAGRMAGSLAGLICSPDQEPTVSEIGGTKVHTVLLDGEIGSAVSVAASKSVLILTIGDSTMERVLANLAGSSSPEWISSLRKRHPMKWLTSISYIDAELLRESLLQAAPPEVADVIAALGLDGIRSMESAGGFDDTGMVSLVRLNVEGAPRGLLALMGDQGIRPGDLQHLPHDSLFAAGLSLEPKKVLNLAEDMLQQFSPEEADGMDEAMMQAERQLGIDIRSDIVEALGSTWCFYNGAADGLLTGLTLTVEVRDREKLGRALDALSQLAGMVMAQERDAPQIVRQKMGDAEVYSLRFNNLPVPVEPSWCICGDRLAVTLFPQGMAPLLNSMSQRPLFDSARFAVLAGDPSTAANPVSPLIGFSHVDAQRQFELAYPYAQMMLTMVQGMSSSPDFLEVDGTESLAPLLRGIRLPPARLIHPHLKPSLSVFRRTAAGFEMETRQTMPVVDVTMVVPVMVGLLLPAVQQVREAAERTHSMNNLKQLLLAAHNYESAFRSFPSGYSVDAEGKPLLSWRVHILPFIEQQGLYNQFHLDEPWDSEHNIQLLERMPETLRSPASLAGPGMTVYRGVGGRDGILTAPEAAPGLTGVNFAQIVDGSSNTLMMVETSDALAVPWTQPDAGVDPEETDFSLLFGQFRGGMIGGHADGSVRFLPETMDWEILRSLMKKSDGGPFGAWDN